MKKTYILTSMLALAMAGSVQAQMTAGQTVGFDISFNGGDAGPGSVDGINFIQIANAVTAYNLDGLHPDGSGSTLHVSAQTTFSGPDTARADPYVPQAGYHEDHLSDWGIQFGANAIALNFGGLDPLLTYDVELVTGATDNTDAHAGTTISVAGQADQFFAPTATANGTITLTGLTVGGQIPGYLIINASHFHDGGKLSTISAGKITAVAVPEPGTYALIGGALALASVMVRRRR